MLWSFVIFPLYLEKSNLKFRNFLNLADVTGPRLTPSEGTNQTAPTYKSDRQVLYPSGTSLLIGTFYTSTQPHHEILLYWSFLRCFGARVRRECRGTRRQNRRWYRQASSSVCMPKVLQVPSSFDPQMRALQPLWIYLH